MMGGRQPRQLRQWMSRSFMVLASKYYTAFGTIWFDYDKRGEEEHDWRIASSPEALAAFNATFAAD